MGAYLVWVIPIVVALLYAVGLVCAVEAVVSARTPQGSVAWALSLVTFPFVSVPLYLVFGRSGFGGYVEAMRTAVQQGRMQLEELIKDAHAFEAEVARERGRDLAMLEKLAILPCLRGNTARLLVDGQATFAAIFEAIRSARSYVLVQFFIIRDDRIGGEFQDLLLAKRREGVRVHVLFDEIGSHALPWRPSSGMNNWVGSGICRRVRPSSRSTFLAWITAYMSLHRTCSHARSAPRRTTTATRRAKAPRSESSPHRSRSHWRACAATWLRPWASMLPASICGARRRASGSASR
jgi:Phospholipase_D-nuclease N-terminal